MRHIRDEVVSLILIVMILGGTIALFSAHALPAPWQGYVKPAFPDYAPSGMPDFDEKQDTWGPSPGWYTWCAPVAAANSLWWLDSEFESLTFSNPVAPPTKSDHFPLVTTYNSTWDDHDPSNVDPLVRNLASLMDTDGQSSHDGHKGTRWQDLVNGINLYIGQQGLSKYFEVHFLDFPDFGWLSNEISKCQDVILCLEFYQFSGGSWLPLTSDPNLEYGHCVTCAGANTTTSMVLISDPYQDAYEAGTAPGRSPVPDAPGHNSTAHNNATYVSQDAYTMAPYNFANPTPPPPFLAPPGYPPVAWELQGYLQTMGYPPNYHAFVRVAIATSPVAVAEWPGYIKPAFPDYAQSGVPDFDEQQNQFTTKLGQYTWCVPVAVANSLWWLDSKYESIMFANPVPPPTKSDHFPLVTNYSSWDDHDPNNVFGLVANLAILMDTDGIASGDGHMGTRWTDIQSGIQKYLKQQGVAGMFEVHNQTFPTFTWIDNETEKCQDVELFLEFWQWTGAGWTNATISEPTLQYGHCVTCAGSNLTASQLLVSDPVQDAYEAGTASGRSPAIHVYPHGSAVHNDALYVSQDAYSVGSYTFPAGPPPPPGYPGTVFELQGYLQTMGFDPSYHTFVRGAMATSPLEVHDVAVTNLTSAKTVICQGYCGNLTATVQNQGNFTETFNVTVYANTTAIETKELTLTKESSTTITFTWNTTGFAKGNYTISAYAWPVPGETDTADNTLADDWVIVSMVGDITGPYGWPDGKCDMRDIRAVAKLFGINYPDPRYNPNCDINDDLKIDMRDIRAVAKQFGKTDP
jgi:hypothetical protein